MPKGETKVPITVSINVPAQANFGRYRGNIKLLTNSLREPEGGQVALAFGALIDVDINVVAMKIVNYNVRGIKVYDTEEDYKFLFLNPPSVVRFAMQIENRGNVKSSPTKILLTLYNNDKTEILHTIETTRVPKVDPFKTEWVTARMPAYLKAGSYQAFYQIFRDDQVIQEGETHLSVNPRGTVTDYEDPTFFDLSAADKIKVVAVVIILCAMVFFIVFGIVKAVKGKQATEEVKEKKPVIRKTTKKRVVKRKTKKQE